jgi:hypothetical protein
LPRFQQLRFFRRKKKNLAAPVRVAEIITDKTAATALKPSFSIKLLKTEYDTMKLSMGIRKATTTLPSTGSQSE